MVRRSFALAHEDDETRRALSLHVEAKILSNQQFFASTRTWKVLCFGSKHPKNGKEGYLMPRLGAVVVKLSLFVSWSGN
jgi:hypothetical protein